MRRAMLFAAALLTGCGTTPVFAPPWQRIFPDAPSAPVTGLVEMRDARARWHIVSQIAGSVEGTGWRWTNERPELRFALDRAEGWKLAIDFSFPAPNFRDTGPVTVSFFVNGRLLDRVRFTTAGDKHFEKPVPKEWIRAGEFNHVAAEVDPPWIAPADKVKLGFVLYRAGFTR